MSIKNNILALVSSVLFFQSSLSFGIPKEFGGGTGLITTKTIPCGDNQFITFNVFRDLNNQFEGVDYVLVYSSKTGHSTTLERDQKYRSIPFNYDFLGNYQIIALPLAAEVIGTWIAGIYYTGKAIEALARFSRPYILALNKIARNNFTEKLIIADAYETGATLGFFGIGYLEYKQISWINDESIESAATQNVDAICKEDLSSLKKANWIVTDKIN